MLCSFDHKAKLIREFGIDEVIWTRFSYEVAQISAEDFVEELLVKRLHAVHIVCGFNFRFGHKGQGSVEMLAALGPKQGFTVTVVPEVTSDELPISSTRIRALVAEGNVEEAALLLGRYPSYQGTVVKGMGRGKRLGFPTANLEVDPRIVLPGDGVYVTWAILRDGRGYLSVTSVGKNPTFAGDKQTVETYILDYSGDLYNQDIELQFLQKTRKIERFHSAAALKQQISADVDTARQLIGRFRLHGNRIVLQ
jgi:riboflavin kinase/FMN adenylyltransferase